MHLFPAKFKNLDPNEYIQCTRTNGQQVTGYFKMFKFNKKFSPNLLELVKLKEESNSTDEIQIFISSTFCNCRCQQCCEARTVHLIPLNELDEKKLYVSQQINRRQLEHILDKLDALEAKLTKSETKSQRATRL